MTMAEAKVWTIGHSTHPLERFVELLTTNGITAVADVRSSPYSRFNPQFNHEGLESALKQHGIAYVFLGRELGARSEDPSCYKDGRVQYGRLARTELFQSGINRVLKGAESHAIALMCAEKEPLECHRTLLVSRVLAERGVAVMHILGDGTAQPHDATMSRLFRMTGVPETDMFVSREDLLAQACAIQEAKIAYVDDDAKVHAGQANG